MKKTILILGPGCPKCKKLAEEAEKAAKELGLDFEIVKVTDLKEIMKYGVLTTPGLAVDGKVKAVGKVLDAQKIKEFLRTFPDHVKEYETLLTKNVIWMKRTKDVGFLSKEDALSWGVTGPTLRGTGVKYDVRKAFPYSCYNEFDFDIPVGTTGARLSVTSTSTSRSSS